MQTANGAPSRPLAPALILSAVAVLAAAPAAGVSAKYVGPVVILVALLAAWHHRFLRWTSLVGLILVVVMFVPIGRYELPASLPFNLELYRLVVALVVLVWLASMLIDRRVWIRGTAFDTPLLLIVGSILASELFNQNLVGSISSFVAKSLTFFLSFVLVYYVIATTIRERAQALTVLKLFTLGGTVIGMAAIVEQRTGYNVFDHIASIFPLLRFEGAFEAVKRGGNLRVFGPAEHPIALGAALALIAPISIYFARTSSRVWLISAFFIVLGSLASESKTAITMYMAEIVIFLILKPRETRRLWPLLVPTVVVVHVFLPGTIGAYKEAFFPKGGLVNQETTSVKGRMLNSPADVAVSSCRSSP